MTSDVSHLTSVFPLLLESIFMSSSLAVILIDWNHSCLETSILRLIQSYLPRWRNRNIRQDVYLCLFGMALAIIYSSSMKNLSVNLEICRVTLVTVVILLSFWLQSKSNVSDKCIGTPNIQLVNKEVGGSPVTHKEQETSASTCCRAGVPQNLLSLFPSSSGPQSEVNMEEEMRMIYVEAFREQVDEEEVSSEELRTAIEYLNTLNGGIEVHRSADKLIDAVDHIQQMGHRLDDSGLPRDYSYEELRRIVVEKSGYLLEDLERVLKDCSFPPSPEEFVEIHHDMKGIVQLEREVEEKDRVIEETRMEVEEKDREMEETRQEMEETLRVVEETTQEVVESRQKVMSFRQRLQQKERVILQNQQALQQNQQALQQNQQALQQNQQALQQKDRMLDQKDRIIQQERQRVRELEQNPEGEWQRRLRELEEEIRHLSAQSDRSKCKICLVKEVQVSFSPCKHLISCQDCVGNLNVCPLCREPIQGTITNYLA